VLEGEDRLVALARSLARSLACYDGLSLPRLLLLLLLLLLSLLRLAAVRVWAGSPRSVCASLILLSNKARGACEMCLQCSQEDQQEHPLASFSRFPV
jgi:hypothetical protein